MNKNKKFVALICALTMIFSVFAGMTVVNADDITQGIVLEYDAANSTADKAVVVAKSVGFTEVESYTVNINLPEGATLVPTKQLITGGSTGTNGYSAATDTAVAVTDGVLVAFEISLAAPLEEAFEVSLQAKSGISMGSTKLSVERANLPIAWTTIPVQSTPEPTTAPVPTAKPDSKPVVLPDMDITSDDVPETTNDLYVAVVVKTKDGNDAVYGKDYVAELELPNGDVKELTKDELSNILNGYFDLVEGAEDMTWADVISGLTFNALSDGLNFNAQLVNGAEVITGGDVEVTFEPEKTPALSISPTSKSVKVGDKVTITATVSNPVEGGYIDYDVTKGDVDNIAGWTVAADEKSVSFKAAAKGTYEITVSYVYGEAVLTKVAKITVTEKTTPGGNGGSSDSSSGNSNGSIAHGGVVSNNNSKVAFVDIDTVPWAEDSILALVNKGVINGRSDSIFDPNGTVTRAEFAKMVVLAFGLTGGSGVDEFSDVENTDWFASYVARGYYNGVISGYDDGTFRPNGLISRQEMAAMIARAVKAANKTLPEIVAAVAFEDADQIADWAMDAVTTLQKGGVINGMTETTYAPLENATRAQAAVIIYRAMTNAK